jgi:hypothetical protein
MEERAHRLFGRFYRSGLGNLSISKARHEVNVVKTGSRFKPVFDLTADTGGRRSTVDSKVEIGTVPVCAFCARTEQDHLTWIEFFSNQFEDPLEDGGFPVAALSFGHGCIILAAV